MAFSLALNFLNVRLYIGQNNNLFFECKQTLYDIASVLRPIARLVHINVCMKISCRSRVCVLFYFSFVSNKGLLEF